MEQYDRHSNTPRITTDGGSRALALGSLSDLGRIGCKSALSGPYFDNFLDHSPTMDWRNRQNLPSLSPFFAPDSLSPTGS